MLPPRLSEQGQRVPFAVSAVHWNMNIYNKIIARIKTDGIKVSLAFSGIATLVKMWWETLFYSLPSEQGIANSAYIEIRHFLHTSMEFYTRLVKIK